MKRILIVFIVLFSAMSAAWAEDVEFRLITLKNVNDRIELAVLRDELMLGSETVDRILITDVLNDGFDENDMLQLYPSGRVLKLAPITPRLDSLLRSYRLPPNVEIHETRQYYSRYDSLARARSGGQALGYGVMAGLSERLLRGYRGESVEGYFKFTSSGNVVQAWNFDSNRVSFPPPDAPRIDTVLIIQHDTIRVPELITITSEPKIIRDTVYIPSELLRKPRGFFYWEALGMFGGSYSGANRESSAGRLALGAGNEWDFGVWDPWISGRQEVNSRWGLRFVAEMAPWKNDSLPPRFLSTSAEVMYIPPWDRGFFIFAGARAYYHDDLFWDRTHAAWDGDLYDEPAEQDLGQYELTVKLGLDKFASYGTAKRFGAWLKLSGFIPGGKYSKYTLEVDHTLTQPLSIPESVKNGKFRWEHKGGTDIELAATVRLSESAQMMVSFGQFSIYSADLHWITDTGIGILNNKSTADFRQAYQTAAIRFAPCNKPNMRIMLEGAFRNNVLNSEFNDGNSTAETFCDELFAPYMETPELSVTARLDVSIIRFYASARYFLPPEGKDAQLQPEAGLYLMFR
ncbi:hypothetical protein EHM69_09735 [candidate division KSB1 bacterium]|nr:MAG: hypothetical protein EHM69_09735 [candidate division KSB1 bacterium]